MEAASNFLHKLLERLQEKLITVLPTIKTARIVKYVGSLLHVGLKDIDSVRLNKTLKIAFLTVSVYKDL